MMKRYAVFTFDTYYPSGGYTDFHSSYNTREEAEAVAKTFFDYNTQVVDKETDKIVWEN